MSAYQYYLPSTLRFFASICTADTDTIRQMGRGGRYWSAIRRRCVKRRYRRPHGPLSPSPFPCHSDGAGRIVLLQWRAEESCEAIRLPTGLSKMQPPSACGVTRLREVPRSFASAPRARNRLGSAWVQTPQTWRRLWSTSPFERTITDGEFKRGLCESECE